MYVRMRMVKWDDLQASTPWGELPLSKKESIGFLEVFNTLQDLLMEYPEETFYQEIQTTQVN